MPRHRPAAPTTSDDALAAVRAALGNPSPPTQIHQQPFDFNQDALERIAGLREPPQEADFVEYAYDLMYVELQGDLFRWAFPQCLDRWRHCESDNGWFMEQFWPALCEPRTPSGLLLVDEWLPPAPRAAVEEFFIVAWLERAARERALMHLGWPRPIYDRLRSLACFGCFLEALPNLWERWLASDDPGHGATLLAWVSSLIYDDRNNPMFDAWTPNEGGGPPCLWEYNGHVYRGVWLKSNLEALPRVLTAAALATAATRAAESLRNHEHADVAALVAADAHQCADRITTRLAHLRRAYTHPGGPEWMRWPD